MSSPQEELAYAQRAFEIAQKDYEAAAHLARESTELSTHERAALTARKAQAWNALETARKRLEEVEARTPKT
jgi:multidrug resistance efflux pump